jgi:hypothetical protein
VFVPPRYSEAEAREAIAASFTLTEALRRLGRCPTGGAPTVLKKWIVMWGISTDHFDPNAARRAASLSRGRPLEEWLTENSSITRRQLKTALYRAGLKTPACEICGQGELWRGKPMSLILDHVNGVRDDNRLHNLRIVCPNCNATLDTHCGKGTRVPVIPRACRCCGGPFAPKRPEQKYCSPGCAARHADRGNVPRKAIRPPLEVLVAMIACSGYEAVGRRFGVSGTSIRKWVRDYGVKPPPGLGRTDTPRRHPHEMPGQKLELPQAA